MPKKQIVLVTGVAGFWGGRVASVLLEQPNLTVIGLDTQAPEAEIRGLDFIQADIRNPLLSELLRAERVDTVCHLVFDESITPGEGTFDLNVMGTMKLMGACAEAGVRKVILKSNTMVYGAHATNSAFIREDHSLHGSKKYGYIRDLVEIEAFVNGFRGQTPELLVTLLRFAHIVGPKADTPMTRFLRAEDAMVLLGFDPMMQIIHENDVVAALVHAIAHDVPGVFNVATEKPLPLWKLMGLASKAAIPVLHPIAYWSMSLLSPQLAPIDLDYLRYPCVADLEKMRTTLGFLPRYTAEETLREFAAQQRARKYLPEGVLLEYDKDRLRDTIERRQRARTQKPRVPRHVNVRRAARTAHAPTSVYGNGHLLESGRGE